MNNSTSREIDNLQLNDDLKQFEARLRELNPRAATFVLQLSTDRAASETTANATPAIAASSRRGHGKLVLAASLFLMWGLGAGMGAAAALAWIRFPIDTPAVSADAEVAHISSPRVNEVQQDIDLYATASDRTQVPTDRDSAAADWNTKTFYFPWMALRTDMTPPSGIWTPKTAYFIAHREASASLPWLEDSPVTQPAVPDTKPFPSTVELSPFEPIPMINQREQLRGLLGDPGRLF